MATLAGAVIRLAVNRDLSLAEVKTADLAHVSFGALINHLSTTGVQPPLHPVLVWFVVRLVGPGDFALRLPALVAGVALIPVAAWLGAELFDRRTAIAAGMIASIAPALVWYSQEASSYALVALFCTLAVIGAARVIRRGHTEDWVLHAVAASLAVWSDWSGIFVVVAIELGFVAVVIQRRRAAVPLRPFLVGWGLDTLALGFQLAALAVLFASQLRHNGGLSGVTNVSASGVSFYTTVSNVSWGLFGFHPGGVTSILSALWPLAMLASLVMIGREAGPRAWLLLGCAVIPAIGVFLLGLAVPGAFDVRYALAAVPLVWVLIAHVATAWPRSRLGRTLVVGGILLLLAGALVDQQIDPNNPRRYEFRQSFAQVQRDAHPGAAVFYEPAALHPVVSRYAPGLHASPLTTRLPTRTQAGSVFVITSFANSPRLQALLNREIGALRATRHLVSYHTYAGVKVWRFR
ncbi:MAG: glycosyltransferase family 39 protein [Solirubrobacterales bacterium]|nr:glycosyltransferase family 39 protein [Solirubrobacterales bacterium]MBV9805812.1 glycosyltransferase family 39 protein [Solirubrobacterales bacterium]